MAHEINNPLGGLFNAIDTLKRHGEKPAVRRSSVDLIERGLRGIRDVVRTALATYRADPEARGLGAADLDDMRLLVRPELERKRVTLNWQNTIEGTIALPSSAVRQILLNLLLNASTAVSENGHIAVAVSLKGNDMIITVEDDGPGLKAVALDLLTGRSAKPVSTGEGTGLGLWMSQRLATALSGSLTGGQSTMGGASLTVRLPLQSERILSHAA
jgi:signal transduction histidine kinase